MSGDSTPSGPPSGFGKGVNDYLNDYVRVADAKAVAVLAATLPATALALRLHPAAGWPWLLRWISLGSFGVSIIAAVWVFFPRLPADHDGIIFWEDIRAHGKKPIYEAALKAKTSVDIESEYTKQNWLVAKVLHNKFRAVQWALSFFVAGIITGAISYLTSP